MLSGSLLDMLTIIFVEMYDFSLTMQSKLHWMAVWAPCQHVSIWIEHRMEEIEACIADSSSAQPICQQTNTPCSLLFLLLVPFYQLKRAA